MADNQPFKLLEDYEKNFWTGKITVIPGSRRSVKVDGGADMRYFRRDSNGCWEVLDFYERQDVTQELMIETIAESNEAMEDVVYPATGIAAATVTAPVWGPYTLAVGPKTLGAAKTAATAGMSYAMRHPEQINRVTDLLGGFSNSSFPKNRPEGIATALDTLLRNRFE
jgi:hypothetical protein